MDWIGRVEEERCITRLEKWVFLNVKRRFADLAVLEEELWKQRAKVKWELQGNKNTKYFHSLATSRKRRNEIGDIEYSNGIHTTQAAKASAFRDLYMHLMGGRISTSTSC